MKKICIVVLLLAIGACKKEEKPSPVKDCDILAYGTFDVYQKEQKVGTVFRKDTLQIETYVGKKNTGLTKIQRVAKCRYVMRSKWIKKDYDTIHFTVNYSMTTTNEINYEMRPTYMKTESKLIGKIVKVSDSIRPDILKMFGNK